jgi:hypothetical protein
VATTSSLSSSRPPAGRSARSVPGPVQIRGYIAMESILNYWKGKFSLLRAVARLGAQAIVRVPAESRRREPLMTASDSESSLRCTLHNEMGPAGAQSDSELEGREWREKNLNLNCSYS